MVKAWFKVMYWSTQLCVSGLMLHRVLRMETLPGGDQITKCLLHIKAC